MDERNRSEPTGGTFPSNHGTDSSTARYSVPEAARALGISERAVRKRIASGTLEAGKVGRSWAVFLPAGTGTASSAAPPVPEEPTAVPPIGTGVVPGGTDLSPLAGLIERLHQENRGLAEAATAWQMRALQAEEKLKALEAGAMVPSDHDAPTTRPDAPGAADPPRPATETLALRWRRWWRGIKGG